MPTDPIGRRYRRRRRGGRCGAVLIGAVLMAALAGCDSGGSPTPPASSTAAPSTSVLPSSSAPPATPEEQAGQAAVKAVYAYFAELDRLSNNPDVSLNDIYNYANQPVTDLDLQSLQQLRGKGWVSTGGRKVMSAKVGAVSLVRDPAARPNPVWPTVHVTGCFDSTSIRVVDETGKSVQLPSAPSHFTYDITVSDLATSTSATPTEWVVTDLTQTAVPSCAV